MAFFSKEPTDFHGLGGPRSPIGVPGGLTSLKKLRSRADETCVRFGGKEGGRPWGDPAGASQHTTAVSAKLRKEKISKNTADHPADTKLRTCSIADRASPPK